MQRFVLTKQREKGGIKDDEFGEACSMHDGCKIEIDTHF